MAKQKIECPFHADKELVTRWETYLAEKGFKYKRKGTIGQYVYHIEVETAQDAYWLGCNCVALLNKIFDGPLTRTL